MNKRLTIACLTVMSLAIPAVSSAAAMARATAIIEDQPKPIEVRVDRPFLFAIQHVSSGACLFLGRVTDPR